MEQYEPNIMELISAAPWHEAVTYRDTWPHEYVVIQRDGQQALLAAFCERIQRGEGVEGSFFHQPRQYLILGEYRYWTMTDCADMDPDDGDYVLNRAPLFKDRRDFIIWEGDTASREEGIDVTTGEAKYRDFFQPLIEELRKEGFERVKKGARYNEYYETLTSGIDAPGGENVEYGVCIGDEVNESRKASVYLCIVSEYPKVTDYDRRIFGKLRQQQSQIESDIGCALVWDDEQLFGFPNVSLYKEVLADLSEEERCEITKWVVKYLPKFKEAFNPHLERILAESASEE